MTIQYRAVKIVPPSKKEEEVNCYYPRVTKRIKKDIRDIAEQISLFSTHSTADVVGVVEAFVILISQNLKSNCSIELGDLGTFSLHIQSEGAETPEKLGRHNIKGVRMAFRPSVRMKKELQNLHFTKIE
jgi:Bacterial DNA-binding protein.